MTSLGVSRLAAQHVGASRVRTVQGVVSWLLAVQAQDPLAARWALGARLPGVTERDVIAALDDGRILRTHVMRGTWQYVVPGDLQWLLSLFGPKVRASAARRHTELGLDAKTLARSEGLLEKALRKHRALTREAAREVLEAGGVSTKEQRLSHLLIDAELSGLLCSGPHEDGKATWALIEHRVGAAKTLPSRAELLGQLATRFFESRGPATLEDFRWWTGLTAGDAKAGLETARPVLQSKRVDDRTLWWREDHAPAVTHGLLPAFDEFLIGYQRRDDVLDPQHVKRINAGGGLLAPVLVHHGKVVGIWRRTLATKSVQVELDWFGKPTAAQQRAMRGEAERYATFLGLALEGA